MPWPLGVPGPSQKYTAEERAAAVALAERVGVAEAAQEVGCSEPSLYNWRKAARAAAAATVPRPEPAARPASSAAATVEIRAACCGKRIPVLTPADRATAGGRENRREALELHFVTSPTCEPRLRALVRRRAVAAR